jgi:hypothetical protein
MFVLESYDRELQPLKSSVGTGGGGSMLIRVTTTAGGTRRVGWMAAARSLTSIAARSSGPAPP